MSDLFCVVRRRRLTAGERKVAVFRYVLVAANETSAIATVREENAHASADDAWSAYKVEGIVELGCYHDDPTPAEKKGRTRG